VICGGPGTGKTTTVVKILALLQEQALRERAPLGICCCAPTGKAAQRLASSVSNGLRQARSARGSAKRRSHATASTIHRALGGGRGSSGRFRHDARTRWPQTSVVVDECRWSI
jgi:exodeoxyribonuclease V alpha subunit